MRTGLAGVSARLALLGGVHPAIESMAGVRFAHDRLEELGWAGCSSASAAPKQGIADLFHQAEALTPLGGAGTAVGAKGGRGLAPNVVGRGR
jgi:hypothetical protein